jgi:hypothetical protein
MTTAALTEPALDPLPILKGIASLRKLTGMYPPGHPAIMQKLGELDGGVQRHLKQNDVLRIDVIHGDGHLDGLSFRHDSDSNARIIQELTGLGIDSIHITRGITPDELLKLSAFLWDLKDTTGGSKIEAKLRSELASRPRPSAQVNNDEAEALRADVERMVSLFDASARAVSEMAGASTSKELLTGLVKRQSLQFSRVAHLRHDSEHHRRGRRRSLGHAIWWNTDVCRRPADRPARHHAWRGLRR